MDLSLDDIIRTKRIGVPKKFVPSKANAPLRKTLNRPSFKETPPRRITDARNRIIQQTRLRIRDARDKLVEITRNSGDVRQRLLLKHQKQHAAARSGLQLTSRSYRDAHQHHAPPARKDMRNGYSRRAADSGSGGVRYRSSNLPDLIDVPRGYVDYDNMERMEEEEYAAASRLSRTVKNDMSSHYDPYAEGAHSEGISAPQPQRHHNQWGPTEQYDPFDVYHMPHSHSERHMSPELLPPPPKGILRTSVRQRSLSPVDMYQRRYIAESNSSHLSYEMRNRLERAPDPHASVGIFSNPLKSSSSPSSSLTGYRIVVSNLHTSVTQSDIKELFEDIGDLYDSRIVRPGVAEVIYKSLSDAEKAVDTYHNRQLDGQPMKCLLVNPRASNKPTAPAIKTTSSSSRLTAGKTPLEIDIDALHKVLFRRH